jgi:hydroxypyruvate reductase
VLRDVAKSLFDAAVRAADPAAAVRRALSENPLPPVTDGRYFVISMGKAAFAMAEEALRHVPQGAQCRAIAVTNYENKREIPGCEVMAAGHPTPDENGARAGREVAQLAMRAGKNDFVLCLISGGASALVPAPLPGITLQDKIAVNDLLITHGFDITEVNLVRQQLSLLKGGGLARLAQPAPVRSLIISDVVGDDLRTVASGPTVSPLGTRKDAADLLARRGLWAKLPEPVRMLLSEEQDTNSGIGSAAENILVGSNRASLHAAAQAAKGWSPQIVTSQLTGDVSDAVEKILRHAKLVEPGHKRALIFGGETTVTLTGTGRGGRNQELALRFARAASGLRGSAWVFLSGGTDGRDGPTDAAGGLVDSSTCRLIAEAGADLDALMANNDSYAALQAADDLLITGATGTNVADVQIFLMA